MNAFVLAGLLSAGPLAGHANTEATRFHEDALQRFDRQDFSGAIIQLKNALKAQPGQLPVQLLLGKALLANGDVVGAEVALQEALRLGVDRSEVALLLAQALVAQGKQHDMLRHSALQPTGLPPLTAQPLWLLRAGAWTDLGDQKEALQAIQEARRLGAQQPEVWLAEVPLRLRARQFTEASQAVERALSLAPASADAHHARGTVRHVQGDLRGALEAYDEALRLDPQQVEALVARFGLSLDLDRLPQAQQDQAALQRAAPREPRAAYLRALLAERQGRPADSQAALREVTALLDPVPMSFVRYRPQLLMLNGLSHFGLNQPEKARQYLEAFLKAQPDSPVARLVARIHLNAGSPDKAIGVLEGYLRVHPTDGQALNLLGSAYLAQKQPAKAAQFLQQALQQQDSPEFRTSLGLSLLGSGQWPGAAAELETAYRQDPGQLTAGLALAQLHLVQRRAPQAVAIARDLVKRQPRQATLHHLLGNALAQAGQRPAARAAFEQALALSPGLAPARLQLARMDIDTGALPAAEQQLQTILKADPRAADAMAEMARIADLRGQGAEALRWLTKARDQAPRNDLRWDHALIDLNLRSGQPGQALEAAKTAAAKGPGNTTTLLLYSRAQLALGDPVGARNTLTSATRHAEFNAPVQTEIAALQLAAEHPAGAAYSLEKALSGQPGYPPALVLQARVDLAQGNPARAEQRARQIVQAQPRRADGHTLLGDIARAQGKPAAAIAAYRTAHQLEPGSATTLQLMAAQSGQNQERDALATGQQRLRQQPGDALIQKAVADLHARAGRFEDAARGYSAALQARPNDVEALNNLANAQWRLRQPAALATAEKAHALAPDNALVLDTLGWVLFQQGQGARALPLLRDARLRAPGHPEIRYHLAKVLAQAGRLDEARAELEAALQISHRFDGAPDAEQLLASLR